MQCLIVCESLHFKPMCAAKIDPIFIEKKHLSVLCDATYTYFHRDCWRQNQETGHKERFHLGGNDWEKAKRFSEADLQCQGSFKLESETGIVWVSWKFASGMYKVKKHVTCLINVRLFVVKQIIFCSSLKDAF